MSNARKHPNNLHDVLLKNLWYKEQLPPMNPPNFFYLSMNTRTRILHLKMCGFVLKEVMIETLPQTLCFTNHIHTLVS